MCAGCDTHTPKFGWRSGKRKQEKTTNKKIDAPTKVDGPIKKLNTNKMSESSFGRRVQVFFTFVMNEKMTWENR